MLFAACDLYDDSSMADILIQTPGEGNPDINDRPFSGEDEPVAASYYNVILNYSDINNEEYIIFDDGSVKYTVWGPDGHYVPAGTKVKFDQGISSSEEFTVTLMNDGQSVITVPRDKLPQEEGKSKKITNTTAQVQLPNSSDWIATYNNTTIVPKMQVRIALNEEGDGENGEESNKAGGLRLGVTHDSEEKEYPCFVFDAVLQRKTDYTQDTQWENMPSYIMSQMDAEQMKFSFFITTDKGKTEKEITNRKITDMPTTDELSTPSTEWYIDRQFIKTDYITEDVVKKGKEIGLYWDDDGTGTSTTASSTTDYDSRYFRLGLQNVYGETAKQNSWIQDIPAQFMPLPKKLEYTEVTDSGSSGGSSSGENQTYIIHLSGELDTDGVNKDILYTGFDTENPETFEGGLQAYKAKKLVEHHGDFYNSSDDTFNKIYLEVYTSYSGTSSDFRQTQLSPISPSSTFTAQEGQNITLYEKNTHKSRFIIKWDDNGSGNYPNFYTINSQNHTDFKPDYVTSDSNATEGISCFMYYENGSSGSGGGTESVDTENSTDKKVYVEYGKWLNWPGEDNNNGSGSENGNSDHKYEVKKKENSSSGGDAAASRRTRRR